MTQQLRFLLALKALQDWHADSVKARDYNATSAGGGHEHRLLLRQAYPGTQQAWQSWTSRPAQRDVLIEQLEAEYAALRRRPQVEKYRDYWGKTRYRTTVPA